MTYSFDEETGSNSIQTNETINNNSLDTNNGQLNKWSKDKVTMNVKEVSNDKTSAILVIEDKNDIPTFWNTYYSLQRLSEANVWYDLKSNSTIEQLMKIMVPNEKGITEIKLDWNSKDFVTL